MPEPPAAEVQQVYDQTKASGRPLPPFDQVKGEIVKFLKQRKLPARPRRPTSTS